MTGGVWAELRREFQRRVIEHYVAAYGGNRTQAARALGISKAALFVHIRQTAPALPPARRGGSYGRVAADRAVSDPAVGGIG